MFCLNYKASKFNGMFIVRPTQKLFNTSRIPPVKGPESEPDIQEWYADIVSTTFKGKLAVLYVHALSKVSVLVKGKTLQQTNKLFSERLELLLIRLTIEHEQRERLVPINEPVLWKTASRSILGYMNDYKYQLDYWFSRYNNYEEINLNELEDKLANTVIKVGKEYKSPVELLRKL